MATIQELGDFAPRWLRKANTSNADVEIVDGRVIWRGGTWNGGTRHPATTNKEHT